MEFGCCAGIEKAGDLKQAGFDFMECTVLSLLPEESDEEFSEILIRYQKSNLPVKACNVLLPGDLKVTGENVDWDRLTNYIENAFRRVHQIKAAIVVFGSGVARSYPEGFSKKTAEQQIINFLKMCAEYAEPLGITVVIEPLNKKESNIINSLHEAADIAKKVNNESVKILADFYHMEEEKESLENIIQFSDYIKHIHVADTGRLAPGTGKYPYSLFMDCIRQAEYTGYISIECKWLDMAQEARSAKKFLDESYSSVGQR
ncbi:sugar phosphate isomerase/epimerase family protein [Alteribacillus sp. HJP-4]|uniref:sugar phosphate isomerase/epimerase family protein n=1 Tax=Alteribacillus sp. HJP-4 TaxID=2775394 RepID=UPI0035CD120A